MRQVEAPSGDGARKAARAAAKAAAQAASQAEEERRRAPRLPVGWAATGYGYAPQPAAVAASSGGEGGGGEQDSWIRLRGFVKEEEEEKLDTPLAEGPAAAGSDEHDEPSTAPQPLQGSESHL